MAKLSKLPQQDQQYDEASTWLARLDRGLSREEERMLRSWMTASSRNRELLLQMARLWDRMDTLARLAEIFPHKPKRPLAGPWRTLAVASVVLVVVAVGIWGNTVTQEPEVSLPDASLASVPLLPNVFETAVSEHSTVNLPDGTQVTLNTNSLVRVEYSDTERLIHLERGEIHVHVSRDRNRPLSVVAGDNVVQAIGTAFNIQMDGARGIELVVTEGVVKVSKQPAGIQQPPTQSPEVHVSAGHTLLLGMPSSSVSPIGSEEIEAKLAWRDGTLIFRGEPLGEAVREVSRYTDLDFVFADEASQQARVAGRFKVGDVDGLLAALHENFNILHTRADNTIVLSSQESR